ncbi:MAG: hypothetical protein PHW13_11155 [Methylococcales bacterium]|nr:hypothetical protein [Methylococcales bacterium]
MASLLTASVAYAEDYPASNFQPKVIYSSEPAVSQAAASASPCEPKATGEAVEVDGRYPAANFQPKVIYSSEAAR